MTKSITRMIIFSVSALGWAGWATLLGATTDTTEMILVGLAVTWIMEGA